MVFSDHWPLVTDHLIKLSSLPVRWFFFVETFFALRLRFLLSCFKYALLVASDALVCVQPLQDKFRSGDLLLRAFFLRDAERSQFVNQTLNFFQVFQSFQGGNRI